MATEVSPLISGQERDRAIEVDNKDDVYTKVQEAEHTGCCANAFLLLETKLPEHTQKARMQRKNQNLTEEEVPMSPAWVYSMNFVILLAIGVYPLYVGISGGYYQTMVVNFSLLGIFWVYGWCLGYFGRHRWNWYAGYTRKCVHFVLFLVPFAVDYLWVYDAEAPSLYKASFSFWTRCIWMFFQTWPFRHYTEEMNCPQRMMGKFFRNVMRANDRDEDRPNTMTWVTIQVVGGSLVFLPFQWWWTVIDRMQFGFIPIMTTGLGDGLAEPVGKKCGKHKYWTKACCTKRLYTRSVEGSATVFVMALAMCALMYGKGVYFWHWVLMMILVPPVMTFTEARSPHTLDNPTLYLMGSALPTLIHYIPMESEEWPWWGTMLCISASSAFGLWLLYYVPGGWVKTAQKTQVVPEGIDVEIPRADTRSDGLGKHQKQRAQQMSYQQAGSHQQTELE